MRPLVECEGCDGIGTVCGCCWQKHGHCVCDETCEPHVMADVTCLECKGTGAIYPDLPVMDGVNDEV